MFSRFSGGENTFSGGTGNALACVLLGRKGDGESVAYNVKTHQDCRKEARGRFTKGKRVGPAWALLGDRRIPPEGERSSRVLGGGVRKKRKVGAGFQDQAAISDKK